VELYMLKQHEIAFVMQRAADHHIHIIT
jgi:hypothetical protein